MKLDKPESAIKMADMALERIKETDKDRRSEFLLLKDRAQSAVEKRHRASNLLKLPVELVTVIFSEKIQRFDPETKAPEFDVCVINRSRDSARSPTEGVPQVWG